MTHITALKPVSALAAALLLATAGATATTPTTSAMDARMVHYAPYTKAAYDAAKGMKRVLFFHATWCPNCKAANADIVKNLGNIPADVVIFKADYDKEVALKKQYGITSQHSFVLVDDSGKALKKWAGGKLSTIISKTKD
ncbi:thioredoxin family protein [Deinococcus arenicola]|uniref:Thioredoxin family protein n=1 Tax=Deinococcus arenicola TaxID=2994950 RepID=A0ABU4DTQ9_9DEIO|nr:thioredoxin family protein [Deinococcus sp. ZS9-10]MDV6375821.1 thioredoxin family protein [Deinococcus sp. ZS9-10]